MTECDATVRPNLATLLTWLFLAVSAAPASAQDVGDAATGQKLAETWCSSCHLVGEAHGVVVSNGAPTFAAIAADKSITVLSLRAFLQTPHARMPDLHLSRGEVDDLASYILTLRAR
ncbi:MAG TPA: c-type cytochrome [Acetobacteraceae bacterium]|jgi:mono/diheme cytochrome c family protein